MFMLWNNKKFRIEKENSCGYNNGRNKKDKKIGRKESEKMDQLVDSLMEELNCNTVFTIPLFGGIDGGHMDHYGHYHDRFPNLGAWA